MSHTVKQIAERYSVKIDTALAWIHSGDLRAVNVGSKGAKRPCWRITDSALADFEAARTCRPRTSTPQTVIRARPTLPNYKKYY